MHNPVTQCLESNCAKYLSKEISQILSNPVTQCLESNCAKYLSKEISQILSACNMSRVGDENGTWNRQSFRSIFSSS